MDNSINQELKMVVMPQSAYQQMLDSVREVKELILGKAKADADAQWIESEEARKMLGVSPKTWQNYRDSRVIPFSQFGRKIYVRRADINAFLEGHLIKN